MRLLSGGMVHIGARIEEDLGDHETGLHKLYIKILAENYFYISLNVLVYNLKHYIQ